VVIELCKNNITVVIVNILKQPKYMMSKISIIPNLIPEDHLFGSEQECLNWIKKNIKDAVQ
jgi:sulfate permease, SulP family